MAGAAGLPKRQFDRHEACFLFGEQSPIPVTEGSRREVIPKSMSAASA
jgi:hypothetical protein